MITSSPAGQANTSFPLVDHGNSAGTSRFFFFNIFWVFQGFGVATNRLKQGLSILGAAAGPHRT